MSSGIASVPAQSRILRMGFSSHCVSRISRAVFKRLDHAFPFPANAVPGLCGITASVIASAGLNSSGSFPK